MRKNVARSRSERRARPAGASDRRFSGAADSRSRDETLDDGFGFGRFGDFSPRFHGSSRLDTRARALGQFRPFPRAPARSSCCLPRALVVGGALRSLTTGRTRTRRQPSSATEFVRERPSRRSRGARTSRPTARVAPRARRQRRLEGAPHPRIAPQSRATMPAPKAGVAAPAKKAAAPAIAEDPSTMIPCPVITAHPDGFVERMEPDRETHEVRCVRPPRRGISTPTERNNAEYFPGLVPRPGEAPPGLPARPPGHPDATAPPPRPPPPRALTSPPPVSSLAARTSSARRSAPTIKWSSRSTARARGRR